MRGKDGRHERIDLHAAPFITGRYHERPWNLIAEVFFGLATGSTRFEVLVLALAFCFLFCFGINE